MTATEFEMYENYEPTTRMKSHKPKAERKLDYKAFVNIHLYHFEQEFEALRYEVKPKWFNTEEAYYAACEQWAVAWRDIEQRKEEFLHNAKHLYRQYLKGKYEL